MAELFFENFTPGEVKTFGHAHVDRDAMVAFARDFDPQPFHVDEAAARESFVGRLIASGWYTAALQMRMVCEGWMLRAAALGSPGLDEMTWRKPVMAGDTLGVRETVLETKPSRSRPEMGLVKFAVETLNGADEVVMTQTQWVMLARRDAAAIPVHRPVAPASGSDAAPGERPAPSGGPRITVAEPPARVQHFDDLVVGEAVPLGQVAITAEEIVRFARAFDPQPFHLDDVAAAATPFGGLAASGWHTASLWMRCLVEHRRAVIAQADRQGEARPEYGPSPGITNLRWLQPVRPGDTIRYETTLTSKRLTASRPGWGLTFSHNTGRNQHGDLVYTFDGSGFMARAKT